MTSIIHYINNKDSEGLKTFGVNQSVMLMNNRKGNYFVALCKCNICKGFIDKDKSSLVQLIS